MFDLGKLKFPPNKVYLERALRAALRGLSVAIDFDVVVSRTDLAFGDYATELAMKLGRFTKKPPLENAKMLRDAMLQHPFCVQTEVEITIAGKGYLNFKFPTGYRNQSILTVLFHEHRYGYQVDNGESVLVEFVSANPTGPLHVGHGRQAALGDAICNLFATQGWNVHREFYYNDAGVQIQTLANSTQCRAKGFKPGDAEWIEPSYNGDYIADIAQAFLAKATVTADDRSFTASGDVEDMESIRNFAVAYLRREQDKDLQAFNLKFDEYYLESSLYTSGRVEKAVNQLIANGKTYEKDGALWLKSTDYGDDKDRVMKKQDGTYTYFVPDVAYHITKWERGYTKVVNIQGTDHHGTIARVRAGLQAADVGIPQGYPDYVLHTMVRVVKGGEEVKISKRAGSYVTLRDLIEWTSKDAVRFFLLSRKPDTEYTFDVDLAVQKNNDNPVYYVQYAHARICSVMDAYLKGGGNKMFLPYANFGLLTGEPAQHLVRLLEDFPTVLKEAADNFSPHLVAFYLRDLASKVHAYYDAERILVGNEDVKLARLALVAAAAQVLRNGLSVLGVSAPESMHSPS